LIFITIQKIHVTTIFLFVYSTEVIIYFFRLYLLIGRTDLIIENLLSTFEG